MNIDIPISCEQNAILQTKILLAIAELLGITPDKILSQG